MVGGQRRTIHTAHGSLVLGGRCLVMGILNATPDSFSDGGMYLDPETAVEHAWEMAREGADLIDIGGESTRPGASTVPAREQIRRVVPVIEGLRGRGMTLPISIDTQLAEVAAAALDAGADLVNDVSGLRADPTMPGLVAARQSPFVLMHMLGTPATMQRSPRYGDVVADVFSFIESREAALASAGVDTSVMIVDPGIGFGKTTGHNLALLRGIDRFVRRWPVLVGPSRKRFIREWIGLDGSASPAGAGNKDSPETSRRLLMGTAAVAAHCALSGVSMIRVHDVAPILQVVRMCEALT